MPKPDAVPRKSFACSYTTLLYWLVGWLVGSYHLVVFIEIVIVNNFVVKSCCHCCLLMSFVSVLGTMDVLVVMSIEKGIKY